MSNTFKPVGYDKQNVCDERQALKRYLKIHKNEGKVDKETAKIAKQLLEKLHQLLEVMGPEFHHSFLAVHRLFMELEDCGY